MPCFWTSYDVLIVCETLGNLSTSQASRGRLRLKGLSAPSRYLLRVGDVVRYGQGTLGIGVLDAQHIWPRSFSLLSKQQSHVNSKILFGSPRARARVVGAGGLWPGIVQLKLEHGSLSVMYSSRVGSAATGKLPTPSFLLVFDLFLQAFIDYRLSAIVFAMFDSRFDYCCTRAASRARRFEDYDHDPSAAIAQR
jgi:hypothetical protein